MNRVIFSLVLYKQSFDEIKGLISSIASFEKSSKIFNICTSLLIHDNSPTPLIRDNLNSFKFIYYKFNNKNVGFGNGHNKNLLNIKFSFSDTYIVINPDIVFDHLALLKFVRNFINSESVCTAPLIRNLNGQIQYSVKSDPTFLSLVLGRLNFLQKISLFRNYYVKHTNQDLDYTKYKITSSYLSGCFLLVKAKIYKKINGFDSRYFLHLEDADFTRMCSKYGLVLHDPSCTITHKWARGSHKSLKQMFYLIISVYKYFRKWGFVIF